MVSATDPHSRNLGFLDPDFATSTMENCRRIFLTNKLYARLHNDLNSTCQVRDLILFGITFLSIYDVTHIRTVLVESR
jgi:hypothetical protein